MHADQNGARKHPETELHGDLQSFCGPALLPNDPSLEPRVRRGRPAAIQTAPANAKDPDRERNTQSD
jgi:hypothetical protein